MNFVLYVLVEPVVIYIFRGFEFCVGDFSLFLSSNSKRQSGAISYWYLSIAVPRYQQLLDCLTRLHFTVDVLMKLFVE